MTALSFIERTDIRRLCGYPQTGPQFKDWCFYQAFGLLEFRMNSLTESEGAVVRRYLDTLLGIENETPPNARLLDDWRHRLCGFLGVPAGPELAREVV